jgi:K+-transporting ATPase KdpF subunit
MRIGLAFTVYSKGGDNDGRDLRGCVARLLCALRDARLWLRTLAAEALMSWLYVLSGLVSLGITIYLVIALLFPEKF